MTGVMSFIKRVVIFKQMFLKGICESEKTFYVITCEVLKAHAVRSRKIERSLSEQELWTCFG